MSQRKSGREGDETLPRSLLGRGLQTWQLLRFVDSSLKVVMFEEPWSLGGAARDRASETQARFQPPFSMLEEAGGGSFGLLSPSPSSCAEKALQTQPSSKGPPSFPPSLGGPASLPCKGGLQGRGPLPCCSWPAAKLPLLFGLAEAGPSARGILCCSPSRFGWGVGVSGVSAHPGGEEEVKSWEVFRHNLPSRLFFAEGGNGFEWCELALS